MSPALMSPRSSWHSVCIVIVASIAQCRHSQTLRIRSQSCQRQSKLPRLPTTNESEREQAPTNRKSCKRAVGCKRHSQRDVKAKLVHHRSFELHAESIEDLHIDREWSSVQTLCADRCVSKCVCVCVSLSQIASSHRKRTHNRRTLDIGCFRTATTLVLLCKPPIDKSKSENLQTLCVSVWCECVCVCV